MVSILFVQYSGGIIPLRSTRPKTVGSLASFANISSLAGLETPDSFFEPDTCRKLPEKLNIVLCA